MTQLCLPNFSILPAGCARLVIALASMVETAKMGSGSSLLLATWSSVAAAGESSGVSGRGAEESYEMAAI